MLFSENHIVDVVMQIGNFILGLPQYYRYIYHYIYLC